MNNILYQSSKNKPPDGELPFDLRHPELEIMLRGLLHELRNPLSSIMTAATLLQDAAQPETVLTAEENGMLLDVVKKESLRLNHILTKFAEYIKLPEPQPTVFDLGAVIRNSLRELQRQQVLTTEVELDDRLIGGLFVRADESQIRQAVLHLLANAIEAMPAGGCLLLEGACSVGGEADGQTVVSISDNGLGLQGESAQRAFQLFFSTKAHHLGLGLPMAKNILALNGGSLWFEQTGTGGKVKEKQTAAPGTRVSFSLPAAR